MSTRFRILLATFWLCFGVLLLVSSFIGQFRLAEMITGVIIVIIGVSLLAWLLAVTRNDPAS